MTLYVAPLEDMRFALRELVELDALLVDHPAGLTPDVIDSVLDEAAKFASGVLAPTDRTGDREGARWNADGVVTPSGYRDPMRSSSNWAGMPCPARQSMAGRVSLVWCPRSWTRCGAPRASH